MSNLIPFEFSGQQIDVQVDEDGNPWWMLEQCAHVVSLTDIGRAASRIDTDYKRKTHVLARDGKYRDVWWINESGLYTLLLRSNKPEAKQFQRWVVGEVLPTIRQTGGYQVQPKAIDRHPDLQGIVKLIESVAEARELAIEAKEEAAEAKQEAFQAKVDAL